MSGGKIAFALWQSETSKVPGVGEVSWDELAAELGERGTEFRRTECTIATCIGSKCPHKSGRAWSPTRYRPDTERGNANVEALTALVMDLDDLDDQQVAQVNTALEPYRHIIHSSHSDRPEARRLRVVAALSREVAAQDWPRFWTAATAMLGGNADPKRKDLSGIYFLPSRPADADYHYEAHEGVPLDVDMVLANVPPREENEPVATPIPAIATDYGDDPPELIAHVRKQLQLLGPAIAGKGGNAHTRRAWGLVSHDNALLDGNARMLFEEANATYQPPWDLDEAYRGPARDGQTWNSAYGSKRDEWSMAQRLIAMAGPTTANTTRTGPCGHEVGPAGFCPACLKSVLEPVPQPETTPTPSTRIRLSDLVAEIRARSTQPSVMTPWPRFNLVMGGLDLGSITLGVGYQGSGKSSYASQLGSYHAEHTGPVIYYLGEMTPVLLGARIIGQRVETSWQNVTRGKVSDEDMHAAVAPLTENMNIIPRSHRPIQELTRVVAEVREEERARGTNRPIMLVVDYVQLLTDASKEARASMVETVRGLQALVEDNELVGVFLSQTSRSNSQRMRKGAEDSIDLADTGAETAELERSATIQFTLSYQQKDDTRVHDVTMAVGKRRFGGPTKLDFRYDGETGLWSEPTAKARPKGDEKTEQIIEQIRIHQQKKCLGGGMFCGHDLSVNALTKTNGPHKVKGKAETLGAILKALVARGRVVKNGNDHRLPTWSADLIER